MNIKDALFTAVEEIAVCSVVRHLRHNPSVIDPIAAWLEKEDIPSIDFLSNGTRALVFEVSEKVIRIAPYFIQSWSPFLNRPWTPVMAQPFSREFFSLDKITPGAVTGDCLIAEILPKLAMDE